VHRAFFPPPRLFPRTVPRMTRNASAIDAFCWQFEDAVSAGQALVRCTRGSRSISARMMRSSNACISGGRAGGGGRRSRIPRPSLSVISFLRRMAIVERGSKLVVPKILNFIAKFQCVNNSLTRR
jgi:hypothetical protein